MDWSDCFGETDFLGYFLVALPWFLLTLTGSSSLNRVCFELSVSAELRPTAALFLSGDLRSVF